jgi:hypothetical protein
MSIVDATGEVRFGSGVELVLYCVQCMSMIASEALLRPVSFITSPPEERSRSPMINRTQSDDE